MLKTLQRLSGAAFFLLGLSYFAAYVFLRNGIAITETAIWMQVADLPFAFSALVYGGSSVYLSLHDPHHHSTLLTLAIGIPLALVFAAIVAMNFWPA